MRSEQPGPLPNILLQPQGHYTAVRLRELHRSTATWGSTQQYTHIGRYTAVQQKPHGGSGTTHQDLILHEGGGLEAHAHAVGQHQLRRPQGLLSVRMVSAQVHFGVNALLSVMRHVKLGLTFR